MVAKYSYKGELKEFSPTDNFSKGYSAVLQREGDRKSRSLSCSRKKINTQGVDEDDKKHAPRVV